MHIFGLQLILKAYLPLHYTSNTACVIDIVQVYQFYSESRQVCHFQMYQKVTIMFILITLHFVSATPQPTISLINSTLHNLSISWSVTSPQSVTSYSVFWWTELGEIGRSVALNDTEFVLEDLLSNTEYHVVVMASGPLGNVNSTRKNFYTHPNEVQGNLT